MFCKRYQLPTWLTVDVDLGHLAEVEFVSSLQVKLSSSAPLSHNLPYWMNSLCSAHIKRCGVILYLLENGMCTSFGILHRRLVSFIYLFSHLSTSVYTHGYLFHTLGLLHCIFPRLSFPSLALSLGALSLGYHVLLMCPHHFFLFFSWRKLF